MFTCSDELHIAMSYMTAWRDEHTETAFNDDRTRLRCGLDCEHNLLFDVASQFEEFFCARTRCITAARLFFTNVQCHLGAEECSSVSFDLFGRETKVEEMNEAASSSWSSVLPERWQFACCRKELCSGRRRCSRPQSTGRLVQCVRALSRELRPTSRQSRTFSVHPLKEAKKKSSQLKKNWKKYATIC